jgi:ribosomal protein S18 acetylase RimI-like enzyme
VDIRPANREDTDVVSRMRLAFLADVHGIEPEALPTTLVDATRSFVESAMRRDALRSWLAEEEGHEVGIVSMLVLSMPPRPADLRTDEGYILNLHVVPEARRRGIGDALLQSCLQHAHQHEVRRLFLRATDDGRPLYERAGFAPDDSWLELRLPGSRA